MARHFFASGDNVSFGGFTVTMSSGLTMVSLLNPSSTSATNYPLDIAGDSGIRVDSSGTLTARFGSSSFPPSSAVTVQVNAWQLLAVTKPAGAGVTPRVHLYSYASDTWTRSNCTSTTSISSTLTGISTGFNSGFSVQFQGEYEAFAVFGSQFSDDQLSLLPYSLNSWISAPSCLGMWVYDQPSTAQPVVDWTGRGGNQTAVTGTSVSTVSVPVLSYGHPVVPRTRQEPVGPQLLARYFLPYSGNNASTLTTPAFTPADGEVVAVKMQTWSTSISMGSVTGGGQTWTSQVVEAPGGFNGWVGISTTTITGSPGSMTVSATPSASCGHSMVVERWGNAQLAATPATGAATGGSSAPSGTVTTTGANSIVSWLVYDNNNRDPSGRVYLGSAIDEALDDNHVGTNGVTYYAYQQSPTAGAQTVGLTAPNTMQWVLAGIEIQALTAGGGTQNGAAAMTAASSLTAAATRASTGAVAVSAATALTVTGSRGQNAAVAMTSGAALTTAGTVVKPTAAVLGAAGTVTVAGTVTQPAGTAMTAASGLATSATQGQPGTATLTAASGLTAAATRIQPAAAAMSGASSLTASAAAGHAAGAAMSVAATLTADATTGTATGATLTAASALAAAAVPTRPAAATLTAVSAFTATATQTGASTAALTATSSLAVTGTATGFGAVTLAAVSALTADGAVVPAGGVALTASASLTSAAQQDVAVAAAMNAAGALLAAALITRPAAAALTAGTGLTAAAGGTAAAAADLMAATSLAADAIYTAVPAAVMGAAGVLTAAAGVVPSAGVTMAAISSLTGTGVANQQAAAVLVAASLLTASSTGGQPVTRRPGLLTPGATRSDPAPGSRPYPILTPGTVRGPIYSGG